MFLLFVYFYALYLIVSRYQLHPFWSFLLQNGALLLSQKTSQRKKINFFQKKIDKIALKMYAKGILEKLSKSLTPQKTLEKERTKKDGGIKRIPNVVEKSQTSDASDSSLDELLSVFHSFNSHKNKK
jgi:hypothetical protein